MLAIFGLRPNLKKNVRLRHIFQVGLRIEERGTNFYQNLAQNSTHPEAQVLCLKLADDEVEHKDFFRKNLAHWDNLPMQDDILEEFDRELRFRNIFTDHPPENSLNRTCPHC